MARVIGDGVRALEDFVNRCKTAGGTPVVKTRYRKKDLTNAVIVACRGAREKVPGGTIINVPVAEAMKYKKARTLKLS